MRNFETQAEFKARLRRSFGRLSCGQRVYDIEDPRHNARRENGHAL